MSGALWGQRPRPTPRPDARAVGLGEPTTPADLTAYRRQLSATLQDGTEGADADEVAVERLLLAFEELASNALRHGRDPIRVTVTAGRDAWLLEVSDAATDQPPTPAVGRDAAQGGLGLYLVAAPVRRARLGRPRRAQGRMVPRQLHRRPSRARHRRPPQRLAAHRRVLEVEWPLRVHRRRC